MKRYLLVFFKGLLMGMADLIPGVSGGTVAFITGVYSDLFSNLSKFNLSFLKLLFKGKFREINSLIDLRFLFFLFIGIGLSLIVFSRIFNFLLNSFLIRPYIYCFFFGLMLSSIFFVFTKIQKVHLTHFFIIILGIAVAYFFTQKTAFISIETARIIDPYLIIAGALASCAMILPGISGSVVLLILGVYQIAISSLSSLTNSINLNAILVLSNLMIGIVFGILSFSKLASFLLKNKEKLLLNFLSGLMIGSLKVLYPFCHLEKINGVLITTKIYLPKLFSISFLFSIFFVFLGFYSFMFLKKFDQEKEKINS